MILMPHHLQRIPRPTAQQDPKIVHPPTLTTKEHNRMKLRLVMRNQLNQSGKVSTFTRIIVKCAATDIIFSDVVSNEAFVLLEPFDKDALAAKRAQISMLVKHRIWSNLGLKEKTSTHSRLGGLLIHANGTIEWVQPEK